MLNIPSSQEKEDYLKMSASERKRLGCYVRQRVIADSGGAWIFKKGFRFMQGENIFVDYFTDPVLGFP